jgi:hypothetical protein
MRGWHAGETGLGEERVTRGKYAIEHVMPRKWLPHWVLPEGLESDVERDRLIHTLGNLTLLTTKLNSKVSNAPWLGAPGKRKVLEDHDVLFLNRDLLRTTGDIWTEGRPCFSPFEAATAIKGQRTNGLWFVLVDQASRRSLRNVRSDYLNEMAVDAEDDEGDEDNGDDEE